jgi:hypothetical protein
MPAIYEQRLDALQFPAHCPVRAILRSPHNLIQAALPGTNAQKRHILGLATTNIFEYGRLNRWSWVAMPNPGNMAKFATALIQDLGIAMPDGIPGAWGGGERDNVPLPGWGLLAGYTKWDNCGGFNSSLAFLARHVFDFAGVETAAISGDFLTSRLPAGTIDPVYGATVRTYGRTYQQVNMYFFTGHEFVKFDNHYFDVTANQVFQQAARYTLLGQHSDEKYCDLRKVTNVVVKAQFQNAEVFEVLNENIVTNGEVGMPNVTQKYLVRVQDNKYNHWSGYLLTALPGVSQQLLNRFKSIGCAQVREDANAIPSGQNVTFSPGRMWGVNRNVG